MATRISINKKKAFLKDFLENNQLKRHESLWILNYLLNHELILNKVHFVEAAEKTVRGIIISTVDSTGIPFAFYKEYKKFTNPEQAFHDIRLNWHSELYIELNFPDAWNDSSYLSVLEDNPFYSWNDHIDYEVLQKAEDGMDSFLYEFYKMRLEEAIAEAVDENDEEAFSENAKVLNELQENFQYGGEQYE